MINYNGTLYTSEFQLSSSNRSFLFGDGVFETMKVVKGNILFFEDHYFRLMASMRIIRMEIPMNFTLEFLENQILTLLNETKMLDSARVRLTVFRNDGGFYLPKENTVSYVIEVNSIENISYNIANQDFEVDLYKDNLISRQLLSTLKTTSKIIQVTASVFAKENDLDSCLMLNDSKNVVEAISGNLFMLIGDKLVTPPISEGCLNGIMRKQIVNLLKEFPNIMFEEAIISPFDLQNADELFITNVIIGIQSITKYRKKEYVNVLANQLLNKLNEKISLS